MRLSLHVPVFFLALVLLTGAPGLFYPLNAGTSDAVEITSDPPGARVEVNGRFIGTTPVEWKIGNWALNPHKSWATSKRLQEPLVMTVIKEGFVPKTVQLTGQQLRWTSLNGANSFLYYVIQSNEYHLKLDKVGDFLGGNPFNRLGPTPQTEDGSASGLEIMINLAMPAVVTLTTAEGSGSGFFVTKNGVIVTNKHVVGASSRIRVLSASGRLYDTESIYTDPDNDLALVKIDCQDCPALNLADPASINVGQDVIAIGSPGLAGVTFRNTVTRGIVSAFRGPGETGHLYLQTDAQINPGNSGGPLLNKWGFVVGVNTLKVVSEGYSGLNFAISCHDVLQMLKRRFDYQAPLGVVPPPPPPQRARRAAESSSKVTGGTLNNEDIFKLKQAGLSNDLLIAKIKSSPAAYDLEPDDLIALKKANLSDAVIAAMLDAQGQNK